MGSNPTAANFFFFFFLCLFHNFFFKVSFLHYFYVCMCMCVHFSSDVYIEVLDSTRIHPENYEWARKMAVDALEYDEVRGK